MTLHFAQTAFSQLLLSGTLVHEGSFEEIQKSYGIQFHPQIVMIVSIDRYPDLIIGKPFLWRMEIGKHVVEGVSEAIPVPFTWIWVAEGVLAVLLEVQLEQKQRDDYWRMTEEIARKIQKCVARRGASVSIGIGSYQDNPYLLHYSYEEAIESMNDRFFQGNQLIFRYEKKAHNKPWQDALSAQERTELLARVRIGDDDGVCDLLKVHLEKMAEAYQKDVDIFKSEVVDLVMTITRIVLESGRDASTILSENTRFIQDLYKTIRYDKFVLKVCEHCKRLTQQVQGLHVSKVSPVIQKAVRYILDNHQRRISLGEVAQYCCLSVYHFSHLFKREIGESFIDYLNRIRVKKSLFYLENPDFSVQQTAQLVGFDDPNYFSRTFKKYMDITPTKYRKAKLC